MFEQQLGRKARALVWPYGEYNEFTLAAARDNGFELTFGLEGGANPRGEASLRTAKRGIIWGNPDVQAFAKFMSNYAANVSPVSAVQLDIDPLYDADKRQMQANLDLALSRVMHTQANTVYLQAFADLEGVVALEGGRQRREGARHAALKDQVRLAGQPGEGGPDRLECRFRHVVRGHLLVELVAFGAVHDLLEPGFLDDAPPDRGVQVDY